jgi:hypothetical protein
MSELKAPREVDMVPEDLRFVPQVKSDIIIQRRQVAMAPVEGMSIYQRDATNTITFNVQGTRRRTSSLTPSPYTSPGTASSRTGTPSRT